MVALVGPSGAGKTTLATWCRASTTSTGGAVRIDGRDVRDLQLASLRDKIGIVAQDTFLFNDTVADQHRLRPARTRPANRSSRPRATRWPRNSSAACRRATTPSSASAA